MLRSAWLNVDKPTFWRIAEGDEQHRYEYVRGRIVQQMAGGTLLHVQFARRLAIMIERQLDPSRWIVLGSDRAVDIGESIRYPDLVVEPVGADPMSLATTEPVFVVEVLSRSSEERDIDIKPLEYGTLASLSAYLVVDPDNPRCLLWRRREDGTFDEFPTLVGVTTGKLKIPHLPVEIDFPELYEKKSS